MPGGSMDPPTGGGPTPGGEPAGGEPSAVEPARSADRAPAPAPTVTPPSPEGSPEGPAGGGDPNAGPAGAAGPGGAVPVPGGGPEVGPPVGTAPVIGAAAAAGDDSAAARTGGHRPGGPGCGGCRRSRTGRPRRPAVALGGGDERRWRLPATAGGCAGRRRPGTVGPSGDGRAPGHRIERVDVDRHEGAEAVPQHAPDQRDPRRSPHQQDRVELARRQPGRGDGGVEGTDRVLDAGGDHGLELAPAERDRGLDAGQQDRDGHLLLGGEQLLGLHAGPTQVQHGGGQGRVVGVGGPAVADRGTDVVENGLVEVDAAQVLDAHRVAEKLEALVVLAQHGGVEGAASKVVDGDEGPETDAGLAGVGEGGGVGLAEPGGCAEAGGAQRLLEQLELVGTPVGRVGDRGLAGQLPLAVGHPGDDVLDHATHQALGRER